MNTKNLTKDQKEFIEWIYSEFTTTEFRRLLSFLRKHFPTTLKTKALLKRLGEHGQLITYKYHYITINSLCIRGLALDAVLHEYAHVLDEEKNGNCNCEHRQSWGVEYARIYNEFVLHYESNIKKHNVICKFK